MIQPDLPAIPDSICPPRRAAWMDSTWHTDADVDAMMCSADPTATEDRRRKQHDIVQLVGYRNTLHQTFPAAEYRGKE